MKVILKGQEAIDRYEILKAKGYILYECIVGSQAYGTALPTSDIDKKFVYAESLENILGNIASDQIIINDDYTGFEISEFFELLAKQSPNMHELLWTPEDCVISCNPLFKQLILSQKENFLSKQIRFSFGEYAASQIGKARGLNKKIVNPMPKERQTPLDFCWIPYKQGSINVKEWLNEYGLKQEYCGLVAIDHMKYNFNLFYDFPAHTQDIQVNDSLPGFCDLIDKYFCYWPELICSDYFYQEISFKERLKYKGIIQKDISNEVSLSSVEKSAKPLTTLFFNLEGYTKYCKDYKEYWDWVDKRNEVRYQTNMSHGAKYDSKNLMHCHRLLDTCIEALRDNIINVRRSNREQLLEIRKGSYPYENLIKEAEEKINTINELFETTTLQESVSKEFYTSLLIAFRQQFLF